ncbi:hypothetical protein PBY51_008570 [Eleginops maclovinus]|uniref:Uncharacterized protein n=1 Tax=Eleginops maclovinus TaxID=56733 RepID=A0AAN7WGS2_ELEMC|nr:hypothetical protein PBY51_008570 [Eleginops maclovinus]
MLACLIHTTPQPPFSSDHGHRGQESCIRPPPPPSLSSLSCPDLSVISSVRCSDSGPLPDLPISSHRNSCNEALWGPDVERAAGQKQPAILT